MIMCATMVIFGIFLVLGENINHFVSQVESEQGIQVFINNGTSDEEIKAIGDKLRRIEGVSSAEYVSKEQALEQMKKNFEDRKDLLDGYDGENNIFPASYIVNLSDLKLNSQVQDQINKIDNIKKVRSSNETIEKLIQIAKGIRIATGVILILLIIISIFIISNTIKLTVHARRREISIMKYVRSYK